MPQKKNEKRRDEKKTPTRGLKLCRIAALIRSLWLLFFLLALAGLRSTHDECMPHVPCTLFVVLPGYFVDGYDVH